MDEPSVIRTSELAKRMGMSGTTLWNLLQRNATLRGCAIDETSGRLWWSVQRLRDRGFLLAMPSEQTAPDEKLAELEAALAKAKQAIEEHRRSAGRG